jgi:hypothetical protein
MNQKHALMLILSLFLVTSKNLLAQDLDTVYTAGGIILIDESAIEQFISKNPEHSPKKATFYSIVLPGLGQAYNGKYWKIPIFYGLGTVTAYGIHFNNYQYRDFRNILINLQDSDPRTGNPYEARGLNEERIQRRMDNFRRDREYMIIFAGVLYALNIVDALVDAHLKEFDLSDDLALSIKPHIGHTGMENFHAGITLNFKIR